MAITVTEKAASEVKRILSEQQSNGGLPEMVYLRMRVVGGGCSGFQH
jgi:Fe-S cluster assembly iron-binding protein IscA